MKAQVNSIKAFDSAEAYNVTYVWNGNQSCGSKCIIKNNATNVVVYEQQKTTYLLEHTINANILTNGVTYNLVLAVADSEGNLSEYSAPIIFTCIATPTFTISNLTNNQIIQNSYFDVELSYSQVNNEELQSYMINLYNGSQALLMSSGIKYDDDLGYKVTGLENNFTYYIKAFGTTLNGMNIETGYVSFNVQYTNPSLYSIVDLKNKSEIGSILVSSNMKVIDCETENTPSYIDDEYIDLTNNNTLYINENLNFKEEFAIHFIGYNIGNGLLMEIKNNQTTIKIYKRDGKFASTNNIEKSYLEMVIPVSFTYYYITSNFIDKISATDKVSVYIKKIKGNYEINIKKIT